MYTIEVDFEVYKQLTVKRSTEDVSCNDVIRELLGLTGKPRPPKNKPSDVDHQGWIVKGVRFPEGTQFRANHKGITYSGRVEGGALAVKGNRYTSPSAAAVAITGNAVNGWRFWECLLPGQAKWRSMADVRK